MFTLKTHTHTHTYTPAFNNTRALVFFYLSCVKAELPTGPRGMFFFMGGNARGLAARGATVNEVTIISSCKNPFLSSSNTNDSTCCNAGGGSARQPGHVCTLAVSFINAAVNGAPRNQWITALKTSSSRVFDGLFQCHFDSIWSAQVKRRILGIWSLNMIIKMWVIYRSVCWEHMLGRGTENEAYCRTFGVTGRKRLYRNVLLSLNMFTWGVAGTVQIPLQVFVHSFPACGLWHIHESSDIYFFSLVMSQFNIHAVHTACSYLHSRPPRDCLMPKHIKRGQEGGGSPGFCGAQQRVWAGRESEDIFVGPQTFLVSFLLNSFDDRLWSGTRATVGGVSAAIFDVKDLHLR